MMLVAKSAATSSDLFHETSKLRKRGAVWRDTRQPVIQPTQIDGRGGRHMLQMGARLSNIARAA